MQKTVLRLTSPIRLSACLFALTGFFPGPSLGLPRVDTLNGSRHANMPTTACGGLPGGLQRKTLLPEKREFLSRSTARARGSSPCEAARALCRFTKRVIF